MYRIHLDILDPSHYLHVWNLAHILSPSKVWPKIETTHESGIRRSYRPVNLIEEGRVNSVEPAESEQNVGISMERSIRNEVPILSTYNNVLIRF
jgi:hypothetical protein